METYIILAAIIFAVFAFGSIIGSFLNVVALRGLSGESIVLPPSKCPKCGNKLKPWHNIPILSYLFLGGKCAFCHEKISIQYPIVEALTGILAIAVLAKYQLTLTALFGFILLCILIVMSVTDIREKIICTGHAWTLIILGLVFNITGTIFLMQKVGSNAHLNIMSLPITDAIIGMFAGALIMEILSGIGNLLVKKRAFGLGDTFIAAGLGAFFGLRGLILALIFSIAIQVALCIPKFFKKLSAQKDYQTIIALVLFLLTAAGTSYTLYNMYIPETTQYILCACVGIIGIWACVRVIKGLKADSEDVMVMPFGPAMALAAAIVLFL